MSLSFDAGRVGTYLEQLQRPNGPANGENDANYRRAVRRTANASDISDLANSL